MRDSWKKKTLGELCSIKGRIGYRGYTVKDIVSEEEGAITLSPSNIKNSKLNLTKAVYISWFKYNESPEIKIEKNNILLVKTGSTYGKTAFVSQLKVPATINPQIVVLRDIVSNPRFLGYLMQDEIIQKQITKTVVGGAIPTLSQENISNFVLLLPPLPHQKKIAQILSTCDAVLEQTEAAIAKYQALKQGMLHDLFTRGIDLATGQLRAKYEDAPELYKETELGFVPREWEVERIAGNSSLVTNGFVGVATPFYTNKENGVRYLFGTNVRADRLDFRDLRYVTNEFHKSKQKSNLRAGDMLTVQSGHIGTSAIIPKDFGEANCHALIITRFNLDIINPFYVSYYLNSALGIKGLEKLFIGSTIKHINTSDLAKHHIPIPDITEQNSVVEKLKKIDKKIHTEQQTLAKYAALKAGLMQDLLSGVVGVEQMIAE